MINSWHTPFLQQQKLNTHKLLSHLFLKTQTERETDTCREGSGDGGEREKDIKTEWQTETDTKKRDRGGGRETVREGEMLTEERREWVCERDRHTDRQTD